MKKLLLIAAVMVPGLASAAQFKLNVGTDFVTPPGESFISQECRLGAKFQAEENVSKYIMAGGRIGLGLGARHWDASQLSVPMDLVLSSHFEHLYVEALAGPWFHPGRADKTVLGHAGLGLGFETQAFSMGLETGWLDKNPMVGANVGLKF